jgi:hypothetical protein
VFFFFFQAQPPVKPVAALILLRLRILRGSSKFIHKQSLPRQIWYATIDIKRQKGGFSGSTLP